jgi:3-phosphoglycerate kinase
MRAGIRFSSTLFCCETTELAGISAVGNVVRAARRLAEWSLSWPAQISHISTGGGASLVRAYTLACPTCVLLQTAMRTVWVTSQ